MKILLVNADARFNLAIRKLYAYFIPRNKVDMIDLDLSFYSKESTIVNCYGYDRVYVSCIFENSLSKITFVNKDNVKVFDIGGIGTHYSTKKLPCFIDTLEPYYRPTETVSYNFITRGCIRNCYFCKVRPSEGYIHLNKHPKDMTLLDRTEFLDNNFLAYSDHLSILEWLVDSKKCVRFNQGLDFRLLTEENTKLLSECNYFGEYIFAFDDISYLPKIEDKLKLIKKYIPTDFKTKWYVYTNYDMDVKDVVKRVKFLLDNKCLPYVMRDKNCYIKKDPKCDFYKDLSAYCNQPSFCKKLTFEQFMRKRTKNQKRINQSIGFWNSVD